MITATTASFRVKQRPLINGNLYNCKWVRNKKKIVHLFIHWIKGYDQHILHK